MGNSAGQDIDPTFYRGPSDALNAPPVQLAYVVAFDRAAQQPDALAVLRTDPESPGYGQVVGWADLPTRKTNSTTSAAAACVQIGGSVRLTLGEG
jgi:selenium-binding protein 1